MIDITSLRKVQDCGLWVIYNKDPWDKQKGRIKSWNKKYVFVVFSCNDWDRFGECGAWAVKPEDLEFI